MPVPGLPCKTYQHKTGSMALQRSNSQYEVDLELENAEFHDREIGPVNDELHLDSTPLLQSDSAYSLCATNSFPEILQSVDL